jgi:hypothetical protein
VNVHAPVDVNGNAFTAFASTENRQPATGNRQPLIFHLSSFIFHHSSLITHHSSFILRLMESRVSRELRRRQSEAELALTPAERVRLSLAIGRRELRMFMSAQGLTHAQALEILRGNKEKARRAAWAKRNL